MLGRCYIGVSLSVTGNAIMYDFSLGACGSIVAKALCCKLEGCGFKTR
jgi:hypothetical protein